MAAVVSSSVVFTGEMLVLLGLVQSAEQFCLERGQSLDWIIMCVLFLKAKGGNQATPHKYSDPSPLSASILTLIFQPKISHFSLF